MTSGADRERATEHLVNLVRTFGGTFTRPDVIWYIEQAFDAGAAAVSSSGAGPQIKELQDEILRLKLQYCVAECWWGDDADQRWDSPEEYADEQSLKVGAEFTLNAATYWEEKFRVTKVPDPPEVENGNDDYECEEISKQREEFPTYFALKAQLEAAERPVNEELRESLGEALDYMREASSEETPRANRIIARAEAAIARAEGAK